MFWQSSSCICGSASLNAVQTAAREGTRVGIVALAGAFAMYVAVTLLMMILTKHYVEARYDRWVMLFYMSSRRCVSCAVDAAVFMWQSCLNKQ
jgi:hypothetical protein